MFKNNKVLIFTVVLTLMLLGVSALSASDVQNVTSDNSLSDESVTTAVETQKTVENTVESAVQNDVESKEIQQSKKSVKTDNQEVSVDSSNYAEVFTLSEDEMEDYDALIYEGSDATIIFQEDLPANVTGFQFVGDNLVVTANSSVVFKNKLFCVSGNNITLNGLTLTYDSDYVGSETETRVFPLHVDSNANNTVINGVELTCDVDEFIENIEEVPFYAVYLNGNNTLVIDSTFNINTTPSTVDWEVGSETYGLNRVMPIYVDSEKERHEGQATTQSLINNTINIYVYEDLDASYPTTYGITVNASNVVFSGNDVDEIGRSGWFYAFQSRANNTTITNNDFYVEAVNYTAGVMLENSVNSVIANNTIFVNSSLDESTYDIESATNEYVAYGIVLTDYAYQGGKYTPGSGALYNVTIENNTILGNGYNIYAIEQFGGENTTIVSNNINITGYTPTGIGVFGANILVDNNTISVTGEAESASTVDYLGAQTTGIVLGMSEQATITNNTINSTKPGIILRRFNETTIQNNTIITEYDSTIELISSSGNTITENYLESADSMGSDTVNSDSGSDDNTIQENNDYSTAIELQSERDTITLDDEEEIIGIFTANDEEVDVSEIKVYINDEYDTSITDVIEGNFFYTFVPTDYGEYVIKFVFEGNSTHNASEASITITVTEEEVEKKDTELNLSTEDTDITMEMDSTITGMIKSDGEGIQVESITVYENDTEVDTISDVEEDGSIMYTYIPETAGEHVLTFVFAGNDEYNACNTTLTINVDMVETSISLEADTEIFIDEDSIISGFFKVAEVGTQVSTLSVYDNDEFLENITDVDEDGTIIYSYTPETTGEHVIKVVFAGNDTHASSENNVTITVNPLVTSIDLEYDGTEIKVDETATITGTLTANDDYISGEITVYENNEAIGTVNATDGEFTFDYTATTEGDHTLTFTYPETDISTEASESITITVKAEAIETSILITYEDGDITLDGEATIIGYLTYGEDSGVETDALKVLDNGNEIATIETDDEGLFMYPYNSTVIGEHTLTFLFEGNDTYQASNASVTFNVTKIQPTMELESDTEISMAGDATITGTITAGETTVPVEELSVYDNGELIDTYDEVEEGAILYTYYPKSAGEHNVTLVYAGDDTYEACNDTVTIMVSKVETEISLDEVDAITMAEEAEVIGLITLGDEEINVNISVYDDGEFVENITSDADSIMYIYGPDSAGEHNLTFVYAGDETYEACNASVIVSVSKVETAMGVDEVEDATQGDIVTITGTITADEEALDVEISVYDNDTLIDTVSSTEGAFTYEYEASDVGEHTITFVYAGDETYETSNATVTFTVAEPSYASTIQMEDITGSINEEVTITAKVTDENSEAVTTGYVIFEDANANIIGEADVEDGIATITVLYKKAITTDITATYVNPDSTISGIQNTSTLTIAKASTIVTIEDIEAEVGNNTFTVTVTDEDGNAVSGGKVVLKINGVTLKDENGKVIYATVKDGKAEFNYTIPDSWADKQYNITAVYSGSTKYASARGNSTFTVAQAEAKITLDDYTESVSVNSTITIKAKVTVGTSPVTMGKVVLKINGKVLKDANGKIIYLTVDDNGEVSLDYDLTGLKANTYTISAVFSNSNYNKCTDTTEITIVK